ncbi:MAG TPA: hypothetical protein VEP90_10205 [Methylomirabilota bacterium]|nr:hypothetical protein [Methylomirabilota bacterium]
MRAEGAIETFGDEELERQYRGDRVIMWLRGQMSTDVFEEFLEANK